MSKESTYAIECPGCLNKVTFVDFHKCAELADAIKARNAAQEAGDDKPKRRRRRRRPKTDSAA